MAKRKSDGLPPGVEFTGQSIRIRFTRDGKRCCETLAFPQTPQGIQAAAGLRAHVTQLAKLGMLSDEKYAELFPSSSYVAPDVTPLFGEYAQLWLNSREITEGTRLNYKGALNLYWMPHLALVRVDEITTTLLRRTITSIKWSSPGVKRNALARLGTILKGAVFDGLISKNPTDAIELPKRPRKEIDPFTLEEAVAIIDRLYAHDHWPSTIYAALYEFLFFTGLRLSEALALRWDAVDLKRRQVHVCRTVALGEVVQRTKTGRDRFVLLNDRAVKALEFAEQYRERRLQGVGRIKEFPYVFPPSKGQAFVQQTSDLHHQWRPTLKALGLRYRPPYNCRHTYATICLMSGQNPAFISQQLGHSVQMLLSTYARWINSSSDWSEMGKLQIGTKLVSAESPPL